jgi:hypothetical protein
MIDEKMTVALRSANFFRGGAKSALHRFCAANKSQGNRTLFTKFTYLFTAF